MNITLQIALIHLVSFYLRHTPLEKGRWRLTRMILPRIRELGAQIGVARVRTRYGFRFLCKLDDWLCQYVYLTGTYEPPTSQVIARLMRRGDFALDIGANVGYFSLLLASLASPKGHVFAFEPIPIVAEDLRRNIGLNEPICITVTQAAVCNQNGEQTIYEGPSDHRGISSLRSIENASQVLKVQGIRLDDHKPEFPHLRLVKIDVEGAEQVALEGMAELVEQYQPFIVIEFTDSFLRNFGHSTQSLAGWFEQRGYTLYQITSDGLQLLEFDKGTLPFQYNVLCVPKTGLPPELRPRRP